MNPSYSLAFCRQALNSEEVSWFGGGLPGIGIYSAERTIFFVHVKVVEEAWVVKIILEFCTQVETAQTSKQKVGMPGLSDLCVHEPMIMKIIFSSLRELPVRRRSRLSKDTMHHDEVVCAQCTDTERHWHPMAPSIFDSVASLSLFRLKSLNCTTRTVLSECNTKLS